MKKCIIEIIILFLISAEVFAQTESFRFSHITLKDGLPNDLVFSIIQSKDGFIWFGSNNGLARYDGYSFKVFQPDPDNQDAIGHKSVFELLEANDGKIWLVFQSNDIDLFDPSTEKFVHYRGEPKDLSTPTRNSNYKGFKDSNGNVWFCSNFGISMFDIKKKEFTRYWHSNENESTLSNSKVYNIAEDLNHNFWIATDQGISFIDIASGNTLRFNKLLGKGSIIDSLAISQVLPDKDGMIWICTYEKGIFKYDPSNNQLFQYYNNTNTINSSLPPGTINLAFEAKNGDIYFLSRKPLTSLTRLAKKNKRFGKFQNVTIAQNISAEFFNCTEDLNNNLWISSSIGLLEFESKSNSIIRYSNNPFDQASISGNQARSVFIDRNDVLWVSIFKTGIDKIDLMQKKFTWFVRNPNLGKNTLSDNNILSVIEDSRGNVWMGTMGAGVSKYLQKEKRFLNFTINANDDSKLSYMSTSALCEDKYGDIWTGSFYGQIDVIDHNTGEIRHIREDSNDSNSFTAFNIRKISQDKDGNLWIASATKGLVEYNLKTKSFIYHSAVYDKTYLDYSFYRTCFIDSLDRIWVGTQSGGLLIYDRINNTFTRYFKNGTNHNNISNNTIYCIYEEKRGVYWIGTAAGLNKFDENKKTFIHFGTKDGLPNNTIYSILPDKSNNFWISTDNGLSRFSLSKNKITNYFESDGLLGNEFNSNSFCLGKSGRMYFGSPKGLISFDPNSISDNLFPAKTILTAIEVLNQKINPGDVVNGRQILKKDISETKEIELTYKDYTFTIEFSALHYAAPSKIKYQYKLENFDKEWIATDAGHRWATYSNLPAGNYYFRVRATNNSGIWSTDKDIAWLQITIIPPFWKTIWFRILIILLILLGIYLAYLNRIRQLKKREFDLETLVKDRTKQLEETNTNIEEKQEEIIIQKESLEEVNKLLKDQQTRILQQNMELDSHRHHLEQMVEDRTKELEEATKKAEESDKLKSAFLANMSHEIRTPMNAIVGFSNLLSEPGFQPGQHEEFIELIKKNSSTLLVLIDDILDLSKIQSHQLILSYKVINLYSFLSDLFQSFNILATTKGNELKLQLDPISKYLQIETDLIRLRQIFSNLINNAIKFTEKGKVEFGVESFNNKELRFYVRDSGIGIPEEWHDLIFERFYKIEHPTGQHFSGIGLGLAISRSLVNLFGGAIWFESGTNLGTTFHFTIPYRKIDDTNISNFKGGITIFNNETVLVAEDEDANFKLLSFLIERHGLKVIRAKNGLEAYEAVRSNNSIKAVLMDIKMPVMDGVTSTKLIKEFNRNMPVVAQTAYAMQEEKIAYEKAGFDYYIVKPLREKELIEILGKVIK